MQHDQYDDPFETLETGIMKKFGDVFLHPSEAAATPVKRRSNILRCKICRSAVVPDALVHGICRECRIESDKQKARKR